MKKLFALVLIVCMLSVAAFAEVSVSAGNVCDAAGNVVEAAVITVEDVEDRANAAAADLLNKAFDLIKNGEENVLGQLGLDKGLFVSEMFAVTIGNTLAEGNYVEIKVDAPYVAAIVTADGANWEVFKGGKLSATSVIALLQDRSSVITESEEFSTTETETIDYSIEIVGEVSGVFTRSVAGKAAPSIVVVDGSLAVIKNLNGEVISNIPVDGAGLIVTPVAERETADDLAVRENLTWAYESILNAESVDALVEEELGDVVVRDLFDVSLYGDFKVAVEAADAVVDVTFADVAAEGLVVLCSHDFTNWHVVAADMVSINADGSVTVSLDEVGAIAFAVPAVEEVEGGVVSPN